MRDLECGAGQQNGHPQTKVKYRDYRDFLDSHGGRASPKKDECKSSSTSGSSLNGESQKGFETPATSYRQFLESYSKKKFSAVRPSCLDQAKPTMKSEIFIQINDTKPPGRDPVVMEQKPAGFKLLVHKDPAKDLAIGDVPDAPKAHKFNGNHFAQTKMEATHGYKPLAQKYPAKGPSEARAAPPPPPFPTNINGNSSIQVKANANGFRGETKPMAKKDPAKDLTIGVARAAPPPAPPFPAANKPNGSNGNHLFQTKTINVAKPQDPSKDPRMADARVAPPPPPPPLPSSDRIANNRNGNRYAVVKNASGAKAGEIDKTDPNVKKLVYNTYREMLGAYNTKANDFVSTLPKTMVRQDKGIARQLESIMLQGGLERLNGRVNPNVEYEN